MWRERTKGVVKGILAVCHGLVVDFSLTNRYVVQAALNGVPGKWMAVVAAEPQLSQDTGGLMAALGRLAMC